MKKSEAEPMTPPPPARSALIAFAQEQAAEARKWQAARLDSAVTWRSGSAADWREGKALAERMEGRTMKDGPSNTKDGREENAKVDERIAHKYQHKAEMFDAIVEALK